MKLPNCVWKGDFSSQVRVSPDPGIVPTPVRESAAGIAACRGEAEDRPPLCSDVCQPLSLSEFSALASGHGFAWTHMAPIGIYRVQEVQLLERWTWDRGVRGLLALSRWVERARSPGYVLILLPVTRKWAAMVSQNIWSSCGLSFSLRVGNSLGCWSPSISWSVELFRASILSAGEGQDLGRTVSIGALCPLWTSHAHAGGYGLGFTITTINSQVLTGVFLHFSGLLTMYSLIRIVGWGNWSSLTILRVKVRTLGEDMYVNSTPLPNSLKASWIRQIKRCRTCSDQTRTSMYLRNLSVGNYG